MYYINVFISSAGVWSELPTLIASAEYILIRSLETVKNLLQSLGKLKRPYLTAVEDKLLRVLELEVEY